MNKIILAFFLLTNTALAGGMGMYQDNNELAEIGSNMYEPNWFSMILGLCFVICLIYLTSFLYQKLIKLKLDKEVSKNEIEIVTSKPLGQNKNLYIVNVNGEYLLLGATQNNITYIKEVKPMEAEGDFSYGEQSTNS